jgi:hypothetical protein
MPAATTSTAAPVAGNMAIILWAGAAMLVLACLGLGSIFYGVPYQQARALGGFTFNDEGFYQLQLALTPAGYGWLRALLAAGAGLGLAAGGWLHYTARPLAPIQAEIRRGTARAARWWKRLPLSARLLAGGLLGLLVIVRTWYLVYYPLGTDEVASYDYFVHQGPLAITSYYPIPNNHIFYNLLARPLAAAGLSPRLTMRLPTLVLGTIGSGLSYGLLARLTGLRRATLLTGLVGLAPTWVYYAAAGRGYFLQICLLQTGFFAVAELLRPASGYRHLSWLALLISSILGFYTIPTYFYPFASLMLGLGGYWLLRARWPDLRTLVVAGMVIFVITLLLYTPVIVVTGLPSLIANRYIAAKTAAQFWPPFRAVLYETAAGLFGPSLRISGPAWLGGALLSGVALRRWVPASPQRVLGMLAWAMLAVPIPLMALQRVYAPLRTVLYLTFFGYLLVVLLGRQWLPKRWQRLPKPWRWPLIAGLVLTIGGYRLAQHQPQVWASRLETQQLEQAYHWLSQQPRQPRQVWLNSPLHELFFAHYALRETRPTLQLVSGTNEGPRRPYDFVVTDNYYPRTTARLSARYQPVYHDNLVTIYALRP